MARVALMTIGIMHGTWSDPREKGFVDRIDATFADAEQSEGFIARSEDDGSPESRPWGQYANPPIFQHADFDDRCAMTLSLWRDFETVFAYAYAGIHAAALAKRNDWFVRGEWHSHVAWWVGDDHTPNWEEARLRYDKICRDGATPEAFNFKCAYDPHGQLIKVDREAVKRIIARNAHNEPLT